MAPFWKRGASPQVNTGAVANPRRPSTPVLSPVLSLTKDQLKRVEERLKEQGSDLRRRIDDGEKTYKEVRRRAREAIKGEPEFLHDLYLDECLQQQRLVERLRQWQRQWNNLITVVIDLGYVIEYVTTAREVPQILPTPQSLDRVQRDIQERLAGASTTFSDIDSLLKTPLSESPPEQQQLRESLRRELEKESKQNG
jgi:hypothetical protein